MRVHSISQLFTDSPTINMSEADVVLCLQQPPLRDHRCKRKLIEEPTKRDIKRENDSMIVDPLPEVPDIVCIKNSALPHDVKFSDWVKDDNHIYISTQKKKYVKGTKDHYNKWCHGNLSWKLYKKEITLDEFLDQFETYARKYLWRDLDELTGKTMGCWCEDINMCHGAVLQRLYIEKMFNKLA